MTILVVSALPPERATFLGRTLPLARAVRKAGHGVQIFTLSGRAWPPYEETLTRDNVEIRSVGPNLRATKQPTPSVLKTAWRYRSGIVSLRSALGSVKPDVIVLAKPQFQNTPPVLSLVRQERIPLVLDVDDSEAHASRLPTVARTYAARLERRAAAAAAVITACSPYLVRWAERSNPGATVVFLPTGTDLDRKPRTLSFQERLHLQPGTRVILYLGTLALSSGHRVDQLLDAFESMVRSGTDHSVALVIAGDGIDAERLRSRARLLTSGEQIYFLGRFEAEEALAMARAADLLVDPVDRSITSEAKSSYRLMLALHTGTPLVTGDVGIRPALLPRSLHGGHLYSPDCPETLAEKIRTALRPEQRARFMTETAEERDRWTWDRLGPLFVSTVEMAARARYVPPL